MNLFYQNRKLNSLFGVLFFLGLGTPLCAAEPADRGSFFVSTNERAQSSDIRESVVGIQIPITLDVIANPGVFEGDLANILSDVLRSQLMGAKSVIVFPEYLGSLFVGLAEPSSLFDLSNSWKYDLKRALVHPFSILRGWMAQGSIFGAWAADRSPQFAHLYQARMSAIAKQFKVEFVGGSIFLPGAGVRDGALTVDPSKPLVETAAFFHADGSIDPNLIYRYTPEPKGWSVTSAFKTFVPSEPIPVFNTLAGRLAVLLGDDFTNDDILNSLKSQNLDFLTVESSELNCAGKGPRWNRAQLEHGLRSTGASGVLLVGLDASLNSSISLGNSMAMVKSGSFVTTPKGRLSITIRN